MDLGSRKHTMTPKPNNFTNCQSSSSDSGGMNFGTGYLFWSSETQFDPKKVFEELNHSFMDCDVNCNICVNFIFALTQHIRAAHGQPAQTDTEETRGQGQSTTTSQNSEVGGQGPTSTTASTETEVNEKPRLLNMNGEEILTIDLEEISTPFPRPNETTISNEAEEPPPNLTIPIPMDETVTDSKIPNELQLQLMTCRFCQNKFLHSTLKSHMESHHPEVSVKFKTHCCRICHLDTTFMSRSAARQHFKESHPGEWPHFCELCNKGVSGFSFNKHLRRCPAAKYKLHFPCVICGKRFISQGGVNRHVVASHPEESSKFFPNCEICGRIFFSDKKLTEHKRETHLCSGSGTNDPQSETIKTLKTEIQPQKKKKVKRFECSTCEKRFFKSENLFRHLEKKHTENVAQEQSYFCGVCNIKFSTAKKLFTHRRKVVHPEPEVQNCKIPKQLIPKTDKRGKRYTCQLCEKEYSTRIKYKRHLQTHGTSEIPNG